MFTIKGAGGVAAMAASEAAGASTAVALSSGLAEAYPGPMRFFIVGMVFSCQTGLDYRKLKKGKMT